MLHKDWIYILRFACLYRQGYQKQTIDNKIKSISADLSSKNRNLNSNVTVEWKHIYEKIISYDIFAYHLHPSH